MVQRSVRRHAAADDFAPVEPGSIANIVRVAMSELRAGGADFHSNQMTREPGRFRRKRWNDDADQGGKAEGQGVAFHYLIRSKAS
jgi:hypothetical protein